MSSVTEGKWQQRPEAWVDDGRGVEVVSWEMLEERYRHRLACAEDDYFGAHWSLGRGSYTTARLCVETGLRHKLAAMALHRLLVERANARHGRKKRASSHGRGKLRPYGTRALLAERERL